MCPGVICKGQITFDRMIRIHSTQNTATTHRQMYAWKNNNFIQILMASIKPPRNEKHLTTTMSNFWWDIVTKHGIDIFLEHVKTSNKGH